MPNLPDVHNLSAIPTTMNVNLHDSLENSGKVTSSLESIRINTPKVKNTGSTLVKTPKQNTLIYSTDANVSNSNIDSVTIQLSQPLKHQNLLIKIPKKMMSQYTYANSNTAYHSLF